MSSSRTLWPRSLFARREKSNSVSVSADALANGAYLCMAKFLPDGKDHAIERL
ncbi:MAG: hypothetical protein PHT99_05375 [Methanoregula sp.]|nr:hypothetical protein [Methanoregula sp.]